MKKLIAAVLCFFTVICMLNTNAVFAQELSAEEQIADVGAADAISDADSYVLTDGGETVLEVVRVREPGVTAALNDTGLNGYYTAQFMLPETDYRVFLTGLTQDNVGEIKQAIVESYTEGGDFDLENLGFIDAEKTWDVDGDENLCWAASTSDLLTYTGWAAKAGFHSADDLFEAFIDAFDDAGGNVEYATGWFINGVASPGGAQPSAGTGRYLPQYNYTDIVKTFDVYNNCAQKLKTVYDRLQNGYGVSFSTYVYGDTGYEGGHSVTCWGFVTDTRYRETAREFYKSIFVTDSDSDQFFVQNGKDRREADDVMTLYAVEQIKQEGIDTYMFDITGQKLALIVEAVTVAPYSADVPYETDPDATLDPLTNPDITIDPFVLTDDPDNDDETGTVFAPDATICYHPYMMNISNVLYSGPLYLTVTVKDAQGDTVYSQNFTYSQSTDISPATGSAFGRQSITPKLGVGDYTITASFNPNHNVAEAYYFNNTKTVSFKVRESYLLGDADGDGEVTIVDATVIQRILARLDVSDAENAKQRGDVSESGELDVMDVTLIQRFLSIIAIDYPVNSTRFYD